LLNTRVSIPATQRESLPRWNVIHTQLNATIIMSCSNDVTSSIVC